MKIAGIQKLTLLDFPGHTACTVFLPGCNMRCGYCHNQELVVPESIKNISASFFDQEVLFNFLHNRQGLLDGVCITGGEPTLHPGLRKLIEKIQQAGFKVKLDTNGTNPQLLRELLAANLLDYVAMDIKSSPGLYPHLARFIIDPKQATEKIIQSKEILLASAIDYEFRTTLIKEIHHPQEFQEILAFIAGAKRYFLQNFTNKGDCIDVGFKNYSGFSESELRQMQLLALEKVQNCGIRL